MWPLQRGQAAAKLLHAISRSGAFPAGAAAAQGVQLPTHLVPALTPLAHRLFNTSFWDVPQQGHQDLYIELMSIRSMLPNRSPFTPHFTPHGVMLMPNGSGMLAPAAGDAAHQQQQSVADEDAGEHADGGMMWADSVKRKRKLKMKKHKLKKRRKLTRHQQ